MTHHEIILIEDQKEQVTEIKDCLTKFAEERSDDECDYHFEHIKGTIEDEYEEEEYFFYDDSVIKEIEKKCSEAKKYNEEKNDTKKVGLLLDVMLTKEDLDSNLSSYYPQADLAKKIYFKFRNEIPVYMITTSPVFATQSDVIMGVDLSEQYIAKGALLKYKIEDDIDKLFAFYRNFKQTKRIPEVNHV